MSDAPHLIDTLFHAMVAAGASDLHLCVGSPPIIRKDGHIQPLDAAAAPLTPQDLSAAARADHARVEPQAIQ